MSKSSKTEILARFSDLSLTLALVEAVQKRRTIDDNGLVRRIRYLANGDARMRIMGAALTLLVRDNEIIASMPFATSKGLVILRDLDEETIDFLDDEQQAPGPRDPASPSLPKNGPRVQFATFANPDRYRPLAQKDKCIELPLGQSLWNSLKDQPHGYVFSMPNFEAAALLNTSQTKRSRRLQKIVDQW